MRFSNLPKVKDGEEGLQTQISSDPKVGLFCHTLDRRKGLLERGREDAISYFLPLAFLVLVLWESWRSWVGSFPEFVDGKLKAVTGIKVRRELRTREIQALGCAVN